MTAVISSTKFIPVLIIAVLVIVVSADDFIHGYMSCAP